MKKVFVFTYSAGYRHSYISTAIEVLTRLGIESKFFDVYVSEDIGDFNEDILSGVDALLFLTSGEIPFSERQKEMLIDFVRGGGGFIGVHNATDTLYTFPEYGEMIGGYFYMHPWTQEVYIVVEDHFHPATQHLPHIFKVFDEIYIFRNFARNKTHVLLKLDTNFIDMTKAPRDIDYFPLAWCHSYGSGKVFYTALGHFTYIWRSQWFQKHLLGGIKWVLE